MRRSSKRNHSISPPKSVTSGGGNSGGRGSGGTSGGSSSGGGSDESEDTYLGPAEPTPEEVASNEAANSAEARRRKRRELHEAKLAQTETEAERRSIEEEYAHTEKKAAEDDKRRARVSGLLRHGAVPLDATGKVVRGPEGFAPQLQSVVRGIGRKISEAVSRSKSDPFELDLALTPDYTEKIEGVKPSTLQAPTPPISPLLTHDVDTRKALGIEAGLRNIERKLDDPEDERYALGDLQPAVDSFKQKLSDMDIPQIRNRLEAAEGFSGGRTRGQMVSIPREDLTAAQIEVLEGFPVDTIPTTDAYVHVDLTKYATELSQLGKMLSRAEKELSLRSRRRDDLSDVSDLYRKFLKSEALKDASDGVGTVRED